MDNQGSLGHAVKFIAMTPAGYDRGIDREVVVDDGAARYLTRFTLKNGPQLGPDQVVAVFDGRILRVLRTPSSILPQTGDAGGGDAQEDCNHRRSTRSNQSCCSSDELDFIFRLALEKHNPPAVVDQAYECRPIWHQAGFLLLDDSNRRAYLQRYPFVFDTRNCCYILPDRVFHDFINGQNGGRNLFLLRLSAFVAIPENLKEQVACKMFELRLDAATR